MKAKFSQGGLTDAEWDEMFADLPVSRTQFEEETFEYGKGGIPSSSKVKIYSKIASRGHHNIEIRDSDNGDLLKEFITTNTDAVDRIKNPNWDWKEDDDYYSEEDAREALIDEAYRYDD